MDDLISRQAALDNIGMLYFVGENDFMHIGYNHAAADCAAIIKLLPSVERHGKWCIEPDGTVMHCDCCGWAYEYYAGLEEEWNHCPHCGARMDL